ETPCLNGSRPGGARRHPRGREARTSTLVRPGRVHGRELLEEARDPLGHRAEEGGTLLRGGGAGVAHTGVIGDLREAAGRPGPALAERGHAELAGAAGPRLGERPDQLRREVEHDAGLELAAVVPGLLEEGAGVHARIPVQHADEQPEARLELADRAAEVVAAVPVQDHELAYALAVQGSGEVGEERGLRA